MCFLVCRSAYRAQYHLHILHTILSQELKEPVSLTHLSTTRLASKELNTCMHTYKYN